MASLGPETGGRSWPLNGFYSIPTKLSISLTYKHMLEYAGTCNTCGTSTRERLLTCTICAMLFHPSCLGLEKYNYLADIFTCASCICILAKIPEHALEKAMESAHHMVWLRAQTTKSSSQATYAAGLARFTSWATKVAGLPMKEALPSVPGEGILPERVGLFISWATQHYACTTIKSTISALAHWHKSKHLDPAAYVRTAANNELLKAMESSAGPLGLPNRKEGMSRDLLRLLISHMSHLERTEPDMRDIYTRDKAWLLLGYFGMLRRSEIIALQMGDITFLKISGKVTHLELKVRTSKTDRKGQGATVTIAATSRDNIPILTIVERWYNIRRLSRAGPTAPLFTQWDLDLLAPSHRALQNGQALASRLKVYLTSLKRAYPGLSVNPAAYGMHSLRRGGVMAAWLAGVDIEKIKSHGRWRSDAIRAYMQASLDIRLVTTSCM